MFAGSFFFFCVEMNGTVDDNFFFFSNFVRFEGMKLGDGSIKARDLGISIFFFIRR